MRNSLFALTALVLAAATATPALAQSDKARVTPVSMHLNLDAPRILDDYACVRICEGTRSSCDPEVRRKADGTCS